MRTVIAVLILCCSSLASAQNYWAPPPVQPAPQCRTYWAPVSNLYRGVPNGYGGWDRGQYLGTRYEQRTYCAPQPRYNYEPWNQPRRNVYWPE